MKSISHEKFTLKLIKENFISLEIHEGKVIEVEDIHLIYQGYVDLVGDNEYVVAIYGNPFSSISNEAKEIAAKQYRSEKRRKVAMITNNLAHVLIVKFFITWNKPRTRIEIFRNEEKAFEWLEFIEESIEENMD